MDYFWIFAAIAVLFLASRYLSFKVTRPGAKETIEKPESSFHTKVVGVSHGNADGTKRQTIIKQHCRQGQQLTLIPEPDNPKDPDALSVWVNGLQIGYIASGRTAQDLCRHIKRGDFMQVTVSSLTGGTKDKPTMGVNILVSL